jgi:peptidoglycan/LPS O-acetylase OafA/YrhL
MAREPALAARTLRDLTLIFAGHLLVAVSVQGLYRWKHAELAQLFESDLMGFAARSVTLIVILLLFKAIIEGKTGTVKIRMMRRLGDAAYPLYLVHLAVFIILSHFAIRDAGVHLSVAVLVAFAFYWLFHPFGQRRARSRKPGESAAPAKESASELEKEQVGELSAGGSHLKAQ